MTTFVLIVLIALVCYLALVVNNLKNKVENFIDFAEENNEEESTMFVKNIIDSVSEKLESLLFNNIKYEDVNVLIKKVGDLNIAIKSINDNLCNFVEKDSNRYKCWIEDIQEIVRVANINNNLIKEKHNKTSIKLESIANDINKLDENDILILSDITTNMNLIKEVKNAVKSKAKNSSNTKSKSVNKKDIENKSES